MKSTSLKIRNLVVNHVRNNYTVYVSPYFVFQNERFTKHYYAGTQRITSKIGNGQFANQYRPGVFTITAGGVNYINRQQQLASAKKTAIKEMGLPPEPPTMKGIYAEPEFSGKALPDGGTPTSTPPAGWPTNQFLHQQAARREHPFSGAIR